VTLVSAQNVEPADRTLRIGNRSLQQPSANTCTRSGGSLARSKPAPAAADSAPASEASLTAVTASRGRAACASRICCRGTPSVSGKIVRRLS
jgi:hypothetical protein